MEVIYPKNKMYMTKWDMAIGVPLGVVAVVALAVWMYGK